MHSILAKRISANRGPTGSKLRVRSNCNQEVLPGTPSEPPGCKNFELRAATNLAHLWCDQAKRTEAHDLLACLYNFAAGFNSSKG
jgi:hypothetical protein